MKNLFKYILGFAFLSVAFSNFSGCTNTASTQKGPELDNTSTSSNAVTNATAVDAKNSDYPPAPSGILQTEIKDLDGNSFKVEDKKGKVVLLNLWATWCGPCRQEMPELMDMQNKYRDQGFEIYGLNVDEESVEDIKTFSDEMKLNYQLAYANTKIMSEFIKITRLSGIPQTILINRDGRMTYAVGGGGNRVLRDMRAAVEKTVNQ